jgi:hypothetical protein
LYFKKVLFLPLVLKWMERTDVILLLIEEAKKTREVACAGKP